MGEREPEDDSSDGSSKSEWIRLVQVTGYLMGAGFQMALAVALGAFLGSRLDALLGWTAAFTTVGALLGFGASVFLVVRVLKRTQEM